MSSSSDSEPRGPHGLRTTSKPCPQCGEPGHEVAMVLGLTSILCPGVPFGEIRAVSPSEPQTVGVDSGLHESARAEVRTLPGRPRGKDPR